MIKTDKIYYPQILPNTDFIGPTTPQYSPKPPTNTYYPPEIPQQSLSPRVTIAQHIVSPDINTQSRQILGRFGFGRLGAIQIGKYQAGVSGQVSISPNGIVALDTTGGTTFALNGLTGDLTIKGTLAAGSVIATTISATQISGQIVNAQVANIDWAKIQNVAIVNADIVNLYNGPRNLDNQMSKNKVLSNHAQTL